MRVTVDTNGLFTTQAGVARYIRGLLKGLRQIAPRDLEIDELAWPVENFDYRQPRRALKTAYRELFWAQYIAPRILRKRGTALLHSTVNCLIPPPEGVHHVLSIMDVSFLLHPERFRRWQKFAWKRFLSRLPTAERILCISRFTADELIRVLHVPASKLEVTYLGCEFHPDEPPPAEQTPEFDVPAEFFLFVGSLEPGKNLSLLKQVYALADERGVALPPLLIVGARWAGVASEGPPPKGWHYLGRQPDSVLVHLYRRSLALLFPSKYEGFGLPLVESMALGCPVICARVASLPEVGGDAACYAELQPMPYLEAMQMVSQDSELREKLVQDGYVQARKFSWRNCAEDTLRVYRDTLV
jgi:alpha-1,3-rhamnosyl/mannosyltransferase